uniref:Uncharacterized protein n=1 Tax=Lepeophtheirus salmonis TaxID=72036 RepID=A0A0K2T314_LEPSM
MNDDSSCCINIYLYAAYKLGGLGTSCNMLKEIVHVAISLS